MPLASGLLANRPASGSVSGDPYFATDTQEAYIWNGTVWVKTGSVGIAHSLATAVNDFLVASGAGAFVKKTLAETKTILDWAADITTHAGAADPHTAYRLESADHSHQSTGAQAGQLDHGLAITGLSDDDHTQYLLKQMAENDPILLDAALSADGKYSGICEAGTAGAALAFGDLVYLAVADSRWELTDANAVATAAQKIGICVLAAAGDGSATTILLWGKVNAAAAFPALTIGAPVFIGEVAGDVVVAAPTTSGAVVRIVGFANTADELFFSPDNTYVELV